MAVLREWTQITRQRQFDFNLTELKFVKKFFSFPWTWANSHNFFPILLAGGAATGTKSQSSQSRQNGPGRFNSICNRWINLISFDLIWFTWQSFVVLFAVCFLPMHVYFLWFYFDPLALDKYDMSWHILKIIGFCLAYTNSCINPIALYCVSTSYRKYFNRSLFCCLPDRVNETNQFNATLNAQHSSRFNSRRTTGRTLNSTDSPSAPRRSGRQRLTSSNDSANVQESYPLNDMSAQRV